MTRRAKIAARLRHTSTWLLRKVNRRREQAFYAEDAERLRREGKAAPYLGDPPRYWKDPAAVFRAAWLAEHGEPVPESFFDQLTEEKP